MRNILFIFILIPFLSFAQKDDFFAENNKVSWQKVYHTSLNPNEIINKLKSINYFYDISLNENTATLKFKDLKPKYRDMGYGAGSMSMYIGSGVFFGGVTINFKEDKYRVTVDNIMYDFSYISIATMSDVQTRNNLEEVALKRGSNEFKKGFLKRDSEVLNYTFNDIFDVSKFKKMDENW
ncbi:hypothetical protein EGI16_12340 [Chryseobacterium sp. G0240]|uniref:hypothetical protein n=1 Tax=Chryseobacterium sp. G0240 TaxID=2487066 RepID=UPI000F456B72|nr:hypothetical protein [Chryseobacterium sp. G0240]ROI02952.1 hypothetical protein EGI16_12340 [Chryseobacterium sp. G0240]